MTKQVLHAAATLRLSPGILQQMMWEQEAANSLCLPWKSRYFSPGPNHDDDLGVSVHSTDWGRFLPGVFRWLALRMGFLRWVVHQRGSFDVLLLRYSVHDPLQVLFLAFFGRRTYLVHHTKEIEELRSLGGLNGFLRAHLEKWTGKASIRLCSGVVAVTPEILLYEQSRVRRLRNFTAIYPNAIGVSGPPLDDLRGDDPNLLFVASTFAPWHGLDLLVKSARDTDEEFQVHLVGDIPESLHQLIAADNRFVCHGVLSRGEIAVLGEGAWLGVSSLAADRKGMQQGCALKVREYLSWGIPCVGSYDEVLPEDFSYYVRVKPNMESVLKAARRMRSATRGEVRQSAEPHISKTRILEQLSMSIETFTVKRSEPCR